MSRVAARAEVVAHECRSRGGKTHGYRQIVKVNVRGAGRQDSIYHRRRKRDWGAFTRAFAGQGARMAFVDIAEEASRTLATLIQKETRKAPLFIP